jgi:ribosomal protein S18 acetylase RimI-like enzyme
LGYVIRDNRAKIYGDGHDMTSLEPSYRWATSQDALAMAELVNIAGEGLPLYLWTAMADAQDSPWGIGQQRAKRDDGSFSYRNTILKENGGNIASALIGYPLPDEAEPVNYDELPKMFVPLQELEDLVSRTWYVNVLATYPEYRGNGYGAGLLSIAEQLAVDTDRTGMSIIVSDANVGARRLYERHGYTELATRRMIKESWENRGENWVLLVKTC